MFKLFCDARNNFSKEQFRCVASQQKSMAKSRLHVLSCLDTRKNQRRSRLKSPSRWVPRGWNCHALQFATPTAWLMWYRLLGPPPRSTPDPLPGQAFMPQIMSLLLGWGITLQRVEGTKRCFGELGMTKGAWMPKVLSIRVSRGISIYLRFKNSLASTRL